MKKVLIVVALMLLMASPAFAFDLGGYVGDVQIKFFDWTMGRAYTYTPGTVAPGTWTAIDRPDIGLGTPVDGILQNGVYETPDGVGDSWGLITVMSITNGIGTKTLWSNAGGEEITGVIWGYDDAYLDSANGGFTAEVLQKGGFMALYLDTTPDFDPTQPFTDGAGPKPDVPSNWVASGDQLSFDPWGATNDGVPFMKLVGVPGVSLLYADATRSESVNGLTSPFSGQGSGYFDVVDGWGNYDWVLNGNANPNGVNADVYAIFDFQGDSRRQSFDAYSSDPALGKSTVIPEPASMALLSLGLLGLARFRRKG